MRYQWLAACAAVVIVLLAATPFVTNHGDGLTEQEAAARAKETLWDKAKRESSEALDATGQATKDTVAKAWTAAKTRSAKAWRATKDAANGTWQATKRGVGDAADYAKNKARAAWETVADFSGGLAGDSESNR